MATKPELRPCPFCGGDNLYIVLQNGYLNQTVGVFCNLCKVTVFPEENDQEGDTSKARDCAERAWNRRAGDEKDSENSGT